MGCNNIEIRKSESVAKSQFLLHFYLNVEISGQINDCLSIAEISGLSTERVFFGGHSLGGIVLESYISGHAELAQVKFISGAYQIQNILKNMI